MKKYTVPSDPLPEWFKLMPPNAMLRNGDVAKLFGVNSSAVSNYLASDVFPKPDRWCNACGNCVPFWKKITILREITRRRKWNKDHAA